MSFSPVLPKKLINWLFIYWKFSSFAFAETDSQAEVDKAIKAMDSKEIKGRRLRVRAAGDTDKESKQEPEKAQ